MKKIFKFLCALLCFSTVFFVFPISAFAETYYVEDLKFYCDLPNNLNTVTLTTDPNDEVFERLNTTFEKESLSMRSDNIYLNSYAEDFTYKIVISMTETDESRKYYDFNTLFDSQMKSIVDSFKNQQNCVSCNLFSLANVKFVSYVCEYSGDETTNPVHVAQYTTIINGQQINYQLFSYTDNLKDEQLAVLNNLINSIKFEEIKKKPSIFNAGFLIKCAIGAAAVILIVLIFIFVFNKNKNKNENQNKNHRIAIVNDNFGDLEEQAEKMLSQEEKNREEQPSEIKENGENVNSENDDENSLPVASSDDESEIKENIDESSEENKTSENSEASVDNEASENRESSDNEVNSEKTEEVNDVIETVFESEENTSDDITENSQSEANSEETETNLKDNNQNELKAENIKETDAAGDAEFDEETQSIFDSIDAILNPDKEANKNDVLQKEKEILSTALNKDIDNQAEVVKENSENKFTENNDGNKAPYSLENALINNLNYDENNIKVSQIRENVTDDTVINENTDDSKKSLDVNIKKIRTTKVKKSVFRKCVDYIAGFWYLILYGILNVTGDFFDKKGEKGSSSVQAKNKNLK